MIPSVIELRQYTLHPGRRDDLIALFEREFVETQEATGIHLIGHFRDLDDPDRFVWLRGFPDMAARTTSLETFYGSQVWAEHRNAANETMIDSDNVLLLRPVVAGAGFPDAERTDAPPSTGVVIGGVHDLSAPDDDAAFTFAEAMGDALNVSGLTPLAVLTTETAPNDFPRLPVRTDGPVVAWFASAADETSAAASLSRLDFGDRLGPLLQRLRLAPTPRSRLKV